MIILFNYEHRDAFLDSLKSSLVDPFLGDYLRDLVLSKNMGPGDTMNLELTGSFMLNQKWINWIQLQDIKITLIEDEFLVLR